MKTNPSKLFAMAIVSAVVMVCASCSTTPPPPPEASSASSYEHGVPGGARVDTFKITAKVTAVDHEKRHLTLLTSDGEEMSYLAGPEVVNFDQIQEGDHVKASVTQQLVVYAREKGASSTHDAESGLIALAPKGAKPGAVMAHTVQVTTRVQSVDLKKHEATLEFPNGKTKTFLVRGDVKLSEADVGREVVIQATEGVAIRVEKP